MGSPLSVTTRTGGWTVELKLPPTAVNCPGSRHRFDGKGEQAVLRKRVDDATREPPVALRYFSRWALLRLRHHGPKDVVNARAIAGAVLLKPFEHVLERRVRTRYRGPQPHFRELHANNFGGFAATGR